MQRNRIFRALSPADFALLEPHLAAMPLAFRQRLQAPDRSVTRAYFILSGIASVVAIGRGDRRQAEVTVVGREGMTGLPVVLGADRSPFDVFVQVEGEAQSIASDALREAIGASPTLRACLLRCAHVFAIQASYTALSNAQGKIEERLARWLLMARDRLDQDEMLLTHDFLALMLGVRRAGVSTALQAFEDRALVRTGRGSVTMLDRDGLEEQANGLYGVPEAELERLFGAPI